MPKLILIGILLFTQVQVNGQIQNDSIKIINHFGLFHYKDKNISYKTLFSITKSNPEAYKELKTARNEFFMGILYSAMTGALIATLGYHLENNHTKWNLIGGGVSLMVLVPFTITFNRHTRNAVAIYNNGLKH